MDDLTLARAAHVLAVIHWIGGVAFVTAVVPPAIAAFEEPAGWSLAAMALVWLLFMAILFIFEPRPTRRAHSGAFNGRT